MRDVDRTEQTSLDEFTSEYGYPVDSYDAAEDDAYAQAHFDYNSARAARQRMEELFHDDPQTLQTIRELAEQE